MKRLKKHLRNRDIHESESDDSPPEMEVIKRYSIEDMKSKIRTQTDEDKLNPIGMILAAVLLACCLVCPMNKSTHSKTVDYFDYFMITIATLILGVMILFCILSLRA